MIKHICPTAVLIIYLLFGHTSAWLTACVQRNYSCEAIRTADGFQYPHECPETADFSVYDSNKTLLGFKYQDRPNEGSQKVTFKNESVVLKNCSDIYMQCTFTNQNGKEEDSCVDVKVPRELTEMNSSSWIAGIVPTGVPIVLMIVVIGISFVCWKRDLSNHGDQATLRSFCTYLWKCRSLRRVSSRRAADVECPQNNSENRNGYRPVTNPCGNGENAIPLEIIVERIDSNPDGNTTQPASLDHSSSNGTLVPTTANSGRTAGDRDDEKDENQSLLSTNGASVQTPDMTSEAAALGSESDSDSHQHGRCSTAPEFDVESTNNHEEED